MLLEQTKEVPFRHHFWRYSLLGHVLKHLCLGDEWVLNLIQIDHWSLEGLPLLLLPHYELLGGLSLIEFLPLQNSIPLRLDGKHTVHLLLIDLVFNWLLGDVLFPHIARGHEKVI
jgi:hypothetical protein